MNDKIKKIIKKTPIMYVTKSIKRKKTLNIIKKHQTYSFKQKEEDINKRYSKVNEGKNINWENPITYTEKMNVQKLYNASKIKTELANKITAREWVKNKIGEKYIIPLLGVYDSFDEIDFEKLPNSFVMKCNHDSGSATICTNKEKLNYKRLKRDYSFYFKRNLYDLNFEMHYKDIEPKILIEKNMGNNINDYKFLCFDGEPYFCWVDVDRFQGHKRCIYDMNWKIQPFSLGKYDRITKKIKQPIKFNEMIQICRKLSKGFDHVRVDLYEINGEIYFGEMTFTSGNGLEPIIPTEYDYKLGELWKNFKSNRNQYI